MIPVLTKAARIVLKKLCDSLNSLIVHGIAIRIDEIS